MSSSLVSGINSNLPDLLTLRKAGKPSQQPIDIGPPGVPRLGFRTARHRPGQTQYQVIRRQTGMGMAKCLARQALQKIALHGTTRQFLGNDQAHPRTNADRQRRRPDSQVMQIEKIPAQDPSCGKYL